MSIKTNWYIITGGPSSGKTTVLNELAKLGYIIYPEAARVFIDQEIANGKPIEEIRSNEAEFQRKVLQMKIDVENRMPPEQLTFFDRGIPDSIAYYKICGENPNPIITISQKRRYKGIFLLDQLSFEKDYARVEDKKLAQDLNKLLYSSYLSLEYKVITIPAIPIKDRVQKILSEIK